MNREFAVTHLFKAMRSGSTILWYNAMAMTAGMIACAVLSQVDDRLFGGVSVWEKPGKFFLSMVVVALTMSWAISLVPKFTRGAKIASGLFVFAAWLELIYITYRAALGEASHFNTATPFAALMYALMGVFAVLLTITSGYVGWTVFRQRAGELMPEAAGVGLMLGGVLATIVGGYLGGNNGHWVGGDLTDATGLPFFNWSTTGGDLRISHFIGLHAAQFLPMAALGGKRWMIYAAAIVVTALTFATFTQAIMGIPLLRA